MSAPPYMNWYPADYMRDTRHLTTEQHGAYRLLIDECWMREGLLPDDDRLLAKLAGLSSAKWSKTKPEVMAFFVWTPDGWRHKRLSQELDKVATAYAKRAAAGAKGGKAKSSNAKAGLQQCSSNQNQNQNQTITCQEEVELGRTVVVYRGGRRDA